MSPGRQFIEHLLDNQDRSSRQMRGHCQFLVVSLAISSGLKFDSDDLIELGKRSKDQWMRWFLPATERHYSSASGLGRGIESVSFCGAYEKWLNRKPFTFAWDTASRVRLCVGRRFWWKGHSVECTSFSKDGTHLTACSYKNERPSDAVEVGAITYWKCYRRVLSVSDDGNTIGFSPDEIPSAEVRPAIEKRFSIDIPALREVERASLALCDRLFGEIAAIESVVAMDAWRVSANDKKDDIIATLTPFHLAAANNRANERAGQLRGNA